MFERKLIAGKLGSIYQRLERKAKPRVTEGFRGKWTHLGAGVGFSQRNLMENGPMVVVPLDGNEHEVILLGTLK